ncbi:C4-dicarboxylate ABC transporter substrate-binding protein [Paracoccus versutus]|uniref:C4-dicarboxylate ABC transporter substrate-binding protein n=1 Tax=Paracoccus versutus TaxID=34007 RepID=UPI001FB6A2D2|nr:C4-dicarboxylate ABC transporter substrate-binding protein [Paracoccus versutus]MCJ1901700.1 C4-dicarboxylate ABC transporter substrate-binding protein [Paracoccus versutus]
MELRTFKSFPGHFMRTLPVAVILAMGAAIPAAAEETLRAITAFPRSMVFTDSFQRYVDYVNEHGQGVIQIEYVGGPEMFPQTQQVDAVRRGIVDMYYGPLAYYLGSMPEGDAWTGSTVTPMQARENGGLAIMQQAAREKLGVVINGQLDGGIRFHIYTIDEPQRTDDGGIDFNGLRIRTSPLYTSFFESLGIVPVNMAVTDVYTGLERHSFDGTGWPSIGIQDLSWDRFLNYRIDPGFFQTDLAVATNAETFDALSDEARELLTRLTAEYEQISYDYFQDQISSSSDAAQAAGMQFLELEGAPRDAFLDAAYDGVWARMQEAGSQYYDELKAAYYQR